MKVVPLLPPLGEVGRARRLAARGGQRPVLPFVPVPRRFVDPLPRELVEEEQRGQPRHLVQRLTERLDVVEDALGNDGVEPGRLLELLQRDLPEPLALRRLLVDRDRVVAGIDQGRRDAAGAPAADLQHARGRRRKVLQQEVGEGRHSSASA